MEDIMMKDLKRKNAGEVEKASPQKSKGAVAIAALLIAALALSGCSQLRDILEPENNPSEDPVQTGPQVVDKDNASIKTKFGVPETGKDGVTAAFTVLHEFIDAGGLDEDVIHLGDYIDLEAGLTVEAYPGSDKATITADQSMQAITIDGMAWGTLGRLIVVGINSFQSNAPYIYQGKDTPPAHVVFQFQNLPVKRRMNPNVQITGGYAASEMREYLVPVAGATGSGVFLAGLQGAGVPKDVLWAPARAISQGVDGTGSEVISDFLWLPTEREMVQDGISYFVDYQYGPYSANGETKSNQAQLAYYTDNGDNLDNKNTDASNNRRLKVSPTYSGYPNVQKDAFYNTWVWAASAFADTDAPGWFCGVGSFGLAYTTVSDAAGGVAPAFCVY
jgi:hypothetical protein